MSEDIVRISFTLPISLRKRIILQASEFNKKPKEEVNISGYLTDLLERYVPRIEE